jgi:hypothetical protein
MAGRLVSWALGGLAVLVLGSVFGCSSTLETGYKPRALGVSDAERKGYYSPKYTRAAAQAEQERDKEAEFRARRPDYRPGF